MVRTPEGTIAIDATGRAAGRGAYLCRDAACWDIAGRKRALEHALGSPIPSDVRMRLDEQYPNPARGGQPPAGEGEAEHRSERASRPVIEARRRQRPQVSGSPPPPESETFQGGARGQE